MAQSPGSDAGRIVGGVRRNIGTGTAWEERVGYSRAVRLGAHVHVAGTCAIGTDGSAVSPGDAAAQARFILHRIEGALRECGAGLRDVVRTRIYITRISDAEAVGLVHGEFFREVRPASTMVQVAGLVDAALLVEIEAEAIIAAAMEGTS